MVRGSHLVRVTEESSLELKRKGYKHISKEEYKTVVKGGYQPGVDHANTKRIVTCVNAMAEKPDPEAFVAAAEALFFATDEGRFEADCQISAKMESKLEDMRKVMGLD